MTVETVTSWLDVTASANPWLDYLALFASAVAENLIPPVPGDAVTVFGAYLVGRGALGLWPVIVATWLGSLVGFMTLFFAGRFWGRAFLAGASGRFLSAEYLVKVEGWFERWGVAVILANRFLSGARSVISFSAGMGRMPVLSVAISAAASILVWNVLLIIAGMTVGANWELVVEMAGLYGRYMAGLLVTLALLWWIRKKWLAAKSRPAEGS